MNGKEIGKKGGYAISEVFGAARLWIKDGDVEVFVIHIYVPTGVSVQGLGPELRSFEHTVANFPMFRFSDKLIEASKFHRSK